MIHEIIRIQYARSTLPESWIFQGGDKGKKIPILFLLYLIRTENKKILVDAGCETLPGFEMENFKTPMTALCEKGIDIADITDVIITHAHHDYIECVKYFKNATVHIQEDEYKTGKAYLECHSFYNIRNRVSTATSYCPEKNRAFIEKYSRDPYKYLLGHDVGSNS